MFLRTKLVVGLVGTVILVGALVVPIIHTVQGSGSLLIGLFAALIVAGYLGVYLARTVSRPIQQLETVIAAISRGDFDTEIDAAMLEREDEIGMLARAFNRTLVSLKLAMKKTAPHLERTIAEKEALLESALDATEDGLLIVDDDGQIVLYNQQFIDMWNLPEHIVESGDDEQALEYVTKQLEDPDAFRDRVSYLYTHPEEESFDVLEFKDGRVFERYSKPYRLDGEIAGRVWSFREVTAHEEQKNSA